MIYQAVNILSTKIKGLNLQCQDPIYVIIAIHIVVKGIISVTGTNDNNR